MINSLFNIKFGPLLRYIKTKSSTQFYSKKQKLEIGTNKLKQLKTFLETFYEKEIIKNKNNIEVTQNSKKQICKVYLNELILSFKALLTNNSFKDLYSKNVRKQDQIDILSENECQEYLYNKEMNTEIILSNIEYFTCLYDGDALNFDFLSLANHYLKLYGKEEVKNVKIVNHEFSLKENNDSKLEEVPIVNVKENDNIIYGNDCFENVKKNKIKNKNEKKTNISDDFNFVNNEQILSNISKQCIASNNRINFDMMKISNPDIPFSYRCDRSYVQNVLKSNDYLNIYSQSNYLNFKKESSSGNFFTTSLMIDNDNFDHNISNFNNFNNNINNSSNMMLGNKRNFLISNNNFDNSKYQIYNSEYRDKNFFESEDRMLISFKNNEFNESPSKSNLMKTSNFLSSNI